MAFGRSPDLAVFASAIAGLCLLSLAFPSFVGHAYLGRDSVGQNRFGFDALPSGTVGISSLLTVAGLCGIFTRFPIKCYTPKAGGLSEATIVV
jgi:hypothetical protein